MNLWRSLLLGCSRHSVRFAPIPQNDRQRRRSVGGQRSTLKPSAVTRWLEECEQDAREAQSGRRQAFAPALQQKDNQRELQQVEANARPPGSGVEAEPVIDIARKPGACRHAR